MVFCTIKGHSTGEKYSLLVKLLETFVDKLLQNNGYILFFSRFKDGFFSNAVELASFFFSFYQLDQILFL
jgi:hypothetical protein